MRDLFVLSEVDDERQGRAGLLALAYFGAAIPASARWRKRLPAAPTSKGSSWKTVLRNVFHYASDTFLNDE